MKTAVYGGSFDPPHLAHVMVCAHVLSASDVDRLIVVPCSRHPFGKRMEAFERRLEMCRLAVDGVLDRVEVSDVEQQREETSYMVDTLDELIRRAPGDTFTLVVGTDVLADTGKWKDFDRVKRLAPLLVVPRLGEGTLAEAVESSRFVLPDVSSTEIRRRLAAGDLPHELLPRRVADYIAEHGLYGYK